MSEFLTFHYLKYINEKNQGVIKISNKIRNNLDGRLFQKSGVLNFKIPFF